MWLVHPLSIIHSIVFRAVPYSAVSRIGFTKSIVKHKRLSNKHAIKVKVLVRHDRMIVEKPWDEIHGNPILVSHDLRLASEVPQDVLGPQHWRQRSLISGWRPYPAKES